MGNGWSNQLPSHRVNASGYALHPLQPAEQHPSRRLAYITQALNHDRLKDEQPSAQSLADASSDVPDDRGKQYEDGSVVPPQAQEVRANAEPSMQPPASHVGVKRQRDLGRRRHHDADDGEDYCPGVYSDTEHSEDDAVRPPRRKRRRASAATHTAGGTAPQQQTRPYRGDSSPREARRPSRRPKNSGCTGRIAILQWATTAPGTSHQPAPARPAPACNAPHQHHDAATVRYQRHCPAPQLVAQQSPLHLAATLPMSQDD